MNQGHKVGATKKNNQKYKFDIFRIFWSSLFMI
jgi:hypothetical protein